MEQKNQNRENRHIKSAEPKISELEKWLESFRNVHGHKRLLEEIHLITGKKKNKKRVKLCQKLISRKKRAIQLLNIKGLEYIVRNYKRE